MFRESPGRDDKAIKFDRTLADKASYVCSRRKITMAEYLSEMCRARIEAIPQGNRQDGGWRMSTAKKKSKRDLVLAITKSGDAMIKLRDSGIDPMCAMETVCR